VCVRKRRGIAFRSSTGTIKPSSAAKRWPPVYYSDNLRTKVLKGIDERAKQGWQHSRAPFGYLNVTENREEPIQPHPEKSKAVMRMFELYSSGQHTFESIGEKLADEGFTYQQTHPKFHRTAVSYMLNNRIYIGEI
jgi:site-specific DNA recombinase